MELDITLASALRSVNPLRSHLSLHLSERHLDFLITDVQSRRHIKKSRLSLSETPLDTILKGLSATESPYRSVSLSLTSFERTLVPDGLYIENRASEYLELLFDLPRNTSVFTDHIESMDSRLVFAIEKDKTKTVISYFPTCRIHHGTSILLESMHRESRFGDSPHVLLHIEGGRMEVLIMQSRKAIFFNAFQVENETDVAYHLLHTLEMKAIDHESIEIALAGEKGRLSEEFELLSAYCPKLHMAEFKETLEGMKQLTENELARDLILLNQYQCG